VCVCVCVHMCVRVCVYVCVCAGSSALLRCVFDAVCFKHIF